MCNQFSNFSIAIGRDGSYVADLVRGGDGALVGFQELENLVYGSLGTPSEIGGRASCSNVLDTLGVDGAGEDSSSGGTVSSNIVGLACDVLD